MLDCKPQRRGVVSAASRIVVRSNNTVCSLFPCKNCLRFDKSGGKNVAFLTCVGYFGRTAFLVSVGRTFSWNEIVTFFVKKRGKTKTGSTENICGKRRGKRGKKFLSIVRSDFNEWKKVQERNKQILHAILEKGKNFLIPRKSFLEQLIRTLCIQAQISYRYLHKIFSYLPLQRQTSFE